MTTNLSIWRLLSKWKHRSPSGYQQLLPKTHIIVLQTKDNGLPCLSIASKKRRHPLVPVLAGNQRKVFWLERHVLEHWLFQDLLQNNCVDSECDRLQDEWNEKENDFWCGARVRKSGSVRPISFQCDALLFEFFLWLVENDDPSLRDLNLNDLMEFYDAEA